LQLALAIRLYRVSKNSQIVLGITLSNFHRRW